MKRNATLLIAGAFVSLLMVSCGGSTKGKWSEEDKAKLRAEIDKVPELVEALGDNKQAWSDCCIAKCEANYNSFAEADSDEKGCEKLVMECSSEILSNGSVKGTWSKKDKDKFRADMATVEELSNFGDSKDAWIDCYLTKCEEKYQSYYHAGLDAPGLEQIAMDCTTAVME